LPREVLDAELLHLAHMGIEFIYDTEIGKTVPVQHLQETNDAVVVACSLHVPASNNIFRAEEKKMPVRSIASGKQAAHAVHTQLAGISDSNTPLYNSTMGRPPKQQLNTYIIGRQHKKRGLTQASDSESCLSPLFVETQVSNQKQGLSQAERAGTVPVFAANQAERAGTVPVFAANQAERAGTVPVFAANQAERDGTVPAFERDQRKKQGLTQACASETCLPPLFVETQEEAARCLHCDCHAPVSCKLRQYATQYGVRPKVFRNAERPLPNSLQRFNDVIFDVGKCIKCGLCVSITQANKEALGLTFTQRGFAMQVSIPFNESLEKALTNSARECVENCPTGALAFETKEERSR